MWPTLWPFEQPYHRGRYQATMERCFGLVGPHQHWITDTCRGVFFANLLKRQLKIKIACSCKTPHEKLLWTCTLLESNHVNEKTEMEKRLKRKDCHGDEIKSHAADRKYSKFNRQCNGWSNYYCLSTFSHLSQSHGSGWEMKLYPWFGFLSPFMWLE